MGEHDMLTLSKKLCAATLGLALLFAATTSANAQSRFGGRLSTKEKVAAIGGGAAAGALLGGLLGGKKGAVIGGLLGAGGGTGYVYYKGRQDENRYGRYYGYRGYRDYRAYDDNRRYDYRDRDRYSRDRDRRYYNNFRR
jgi:hypothetical protein